MTNPLPSLRDLQKWLRWVITDPRGVDVLCEKERTTVSHPRYIEPSPSGFSQIHDGPPLSVLERLDIYAEGYFFRIVDALEKHFELTASVLGCADFQKLIAQYLKSFPSKYKGLAEVGRNLPMFLIESSLFSQSHPYLADLTLFEWLISLSYFADDPIATNYEDLSKFTPEEWACKSFYLHPSLQLMKTTYSLREAREHWKSYPEPRDASQLPNLIAPSKEWLLIYRPGGSVMVESMEQEKFQILRLVQKGKTLAKICEESICQPSFYGESDSSAPDPTLNCFGHWISKGIILGVQTQDNHSVSFPNK